MTASRTNKGDAGSGEDDPQYIVRLVGKVVQVCVETVKIVAGLPGELRDERGERSRVSGPMLSFAS
jgi:hypothetical protein